MQEALGDKLFEMICHFLDTKTSDSGVRLVDNNKEPLDFYAAMANGLITPH